MISRVFSMLLGHLWEAAEKLDQVKPQNDHHSTHLEAECDPGIQEHPPAVPGCPVVVSET